MDDLERRRLRALHRRAARRHRDGADLIAAGRDVAGRDRRRRRPPGGGRGDRDGRDRSPGTRRCRVDLDANRRNVRRGGTRCHDRQPRAGQGARRRVVNRERDRCWRRSGRRRDGRLRQDDLGHRRRRLWLDVGDEQAGDGGGRRAGQPAGRRAHPVVDRTADRAGSVDKDRLRPDRRQRLEGAVGLMGALDDVRGGVGHRLPGQGHAPDRGHRAQAGRRRERRLKLRNGGPNSGHPRCHLG